jgi:hypothetical protein
MKNTNRFCEIRVIDDTKQAPFNILLAYQLRDTDLWGFEGVLMHGVQSGYLTGQNEAWARGMLGTIGRLREIYSGEEYE